MPNSPKTAFNTGAVAVIDILGFKGIWQRNRAADVLNKLKVLRLALEDYVCTLTQRTLMEGVNDDGDPVMVRLPRPVIEVRFLSDTIVATCYFKGKFGRVVPEGIALRELVNFVSVAQMFGGLLPDPAFTYRGCLTVGKFLVEDNFLIGPAIDEAAMMADKAQAAVIWLSEAARTIIQSDLEAHASILQEGDFVDDIPYLWDLIPFSVPMKEIGAFQTFVVNPILFLGDAETGFYLDRVSSSFGTASKPLEVAIKFQNTMHLLGLAQQRAKVASESVQGYLDAVAAASSLPGPTVQSLSVSKDPTT